MSLNNSSTALVVLSGGQDSTTCLAIAANRYETVHAITFDYNQKHDIELQSARAIADAMKVKSHEIITLGPVLVGTSPLVNVNEPLGKYDSAEQLPGGIEPTFVPGRNILFLTLAANRAAALGCDNIYTGLCQEDYGGYPDCTQPFVDRMMTAINQGIYGLDGRLHINTPLMNLDKEASVKAAIAALGNRFEEIMELTHTCYDGVKGGCGKCHACHLRDRGFVEAGVVDPIWKHRPDQSLVPQLSTASSSR